VGQQVEAAAGGVAVAEEALASQRGVLLLPVHCLAGVALPHGDDDAHPLQLPHPLYAAAGAALAPISAPLPQSLQQIH